MHGHGAKPFLCKFEGCERAHENHGFPRRWNLLDHMKRVHGYSASEPSNKSDSPSPSDSSSHNPQKDPATGQRKKRTPSPAENSVAKRVKLTTSRPDGQALTTSAGVSGCAAMATREQSALQQHQQYSPDGLLLREYQSRMESRFRNLDFNDSLVLEQYPRESPVFENLPGKFYGRKQVA